jgi:uncharacterized protein (TIGR03000 family)
VGSAGAWRGGTAWRGASPRTAVASTAFRGAYAGRASSFNRGWSGASLYNRGLYGAGWSNRGWYGAGWGNRGWYGRGYWGWGGWPGWWGGYGWGGWGWPWWSLGSYLPWFNSPWYYGYGVNSYPYYADSTAIYAPADTFVDVPPAQPQAPPQAQQLPPPAPTDMTAAHIRVLVPPDAQVWLNGAPTNQSGAVRVLTSPSLDASQPTTLEIRADWHVGNQVVSQTQKLTVFAGDAVTVRFK